MVLLLVEVVDGQAGGREGELYSHDLWSPPVFYVFFSAFQRLWDPPMRDGASDQDHATTDPWGSWERVPGVAG